MTDQRIAELESQVRRLEARNASTADELRVSRDREKALREQVERLADECDAWSDAAEDWAGCYIVGHGAEKRAMAGDAIHARSRNASNSMTAAEARCAALEGALRDAEDELAQVANVAHEFGQHDTDCDYVDGAGPCSCGWCSALARLPAYTGLNEALAAAVPQPPLSPELQMCEAVERFVDHRRSHGPNASPVEDASVRGVTAAAAVGEVTVSGTGSPIEGPAVPQREPDPFAGQYEGLECAGCDKRVTLVHTICDECWDDAREDWTDATWRARRGLLTLEEARRDINGEPPPAGEPTPARVRVLPRRAPCCEWRDEYQLLSKRLDEELARNTHPSQHDFIPGDPSCGWENQCAQPVFDGARRHCGYPIEQHRTANAAQPAPLPELPSGWTRSDLGHYVGPHGDCVMFYDDGYFGLDGYNVTLAELQQLIAHHLATAPGAVREGE